MLPPSSGSKNKPRNQQALLAATCLLLGLFFDPEDGGDMFLQNIG
jgi:hypothetical protein